MTNILLVSMVLSAVVVFAIVAIWVAICLLQHKCSADRQQRREMREGLFAVQAGNYGGRDDDESRFVPVTHTVRMGNMMTYPENRRYAEDVGIWPGATAI